MKLLHIIASPRNDSSNTLRVASALLDTLAESVPDLTVDTIDLFVADLPAVAGDNIEAKYTLMVGQPIDKHQADSWHQIEREITHFLSADAYVISAPMWNFSIPYALKYYIDCIVQPGYLFRYDETGTPLPLVHGKKMVVVSSSGGDYSDESPLHDYNFNEPYLRAIFGFVGIYDITFVTGQAMDVSQPIREAGLGRAIEQARSVARDESWRQLGAVPV
jgi:FMN-dependent NADH-azoreductase